MKHVLIIKPDGTLKLRCWPKREEQLDFLQELFGGYIETVRTGTPGVIMVINEEGRLHGLPYNGLASQVYYEGFGASPIVGTAVLVKDADDELDGLDQAAATLMMGHLFELKTEEVTA